MSDKSDKKDFDEELRDIIEDLDRQLIVLSTDNNIFHNTIINLISKSPKSKEIVQFIVSINDKMETKNDVLKEVLSDSIRTLINKKIEIYKSLRDELDDLQNKTNIIYDNTNNDIKNKMKNNIENIIKNVSSNKKLYLFSTITILLLLAILIMPTKLIIILKMIMALKP